MSIFLWPEHVPYSTGKPLSEKPSVIPYLVKSEKPTGAVIICPGGGYARRAPHEGEPVARWLNNIGISAFLLNYRVHPHLHPAPLSDAKRAIRSVRHFTQEWNIDPSKICILGFSAGGHLASTVGTLFDQGEPDAQDPIERHSSRPDLMILCYPVISFEEYGHQRSVNHLLGVDASIELMRQLSTHTQVTTETPPTFIWHTSDDASVPVENSFLFAAALSRYKVAFELHSFESGPHGLGLALDHPQTQAWTNLCQLWLEKHWSLEVNI